MVCVGVNVKLQGHEEIKTETKSKVQKKKEDKMKTKTRGWTYCTIPDSAHGVESEFVRTEL